MLTCTLTTRQIPETKNILYILIQDGYTSFDTLVAPKFLDLTILVNSDNHHAGTNKTYFLMKRDFFWKEM